MRKLRAEPMAYSSVVGGGLRLVDQDGAVRFCILLTGTTEGITREEDEAIVRQLAAAIEAHGPIVVEDRP